MNGAKPEYSNGPTANTTEKNKEIFSLEFHRDEDKIVVRSCEGLSSELQTLKKCDDTKISLAKTEEYSNKIKDLLSSANREGSVGREILASLKQTGQLLYDELLPARTKESLNNTRIKNLVLGIDDRLINIPWELLYDGKEFLCQRFNMGRVVSTRQQFSAKQRDVHAPLKILLLADPQENLPSSYDEGIQLRDFLDEKDELADTDLKSSDITVDYVKGKLRQYDIVHYAGHADYHAENPAESGFLLSDGRLTASDIKEMVGRTPFPAFVFSNACNSGQTAEWKIERGYENVFGLANAFLVSGVRHYIGTFWEIQDEPSLQFALSFYGALMNGAMIGEAVRNARQSLVNKFGEDTVIWASYMLYGDPTFQYLDNRKPEQHFQGPSEKQEPFGGPLRGPESVVSFPRSKRKAYITGASIIAFGIVLAALLFSNVRKPTSPEGQQTLSAPIVALGQNKTEHKNIDDLIDELATRYKEENYPSPAKQDEWNSGPAQSLVFLDIKRIGVSEIEKDIILNRLIEDLQASNRVNIVERQILDKLLTELNLSSSALADPTTALKLGKILSARLIATGNIVRQQNEWMTSFRVIETETSSVMAAISQSLKTRDSQAVAEDLGGKILLKIGKAYPLQAKIISVDGANVSIDLGSDSGISTGVRFQVFTDELVPVGETEVVSFRKNSSVARILGGMSEMKKGQLVRELYPSDG